MLSLNVQNMKPMQEASEYDQEIPQSSTAVQPMAPYGRSTEH